MNVLSAVGIFSIISVFVGLHHIHQASEVNVLICKGNDTTFVGMKIDFEVVKAQFDIEWTCTEKKMSRATWYETRAALDRSFVNHVKRSK